MALKTHVNNKTHEKLTQQNQIKNFFVKKIKPTLKHQWKKAKVTHQIAAKMCFKLNFLVDIFKANSIHFSRFKMKVN